MKPPKDSPKHVSRTTTHFARPLQGFPEAITRDWTQDVAKIPDALRNQHFPQGSPGILPVSPHTLCMSCPRIPRSVARELPGIAAKIPPKICRDVPSSLTDLPKHSPRKSTKNAPPRISTDSQKTFVRLPTSSPRHSSENPPRNLPGPPKHVPTSPKHLEQPPQGLTREVAQECTEGFAQPSQGSCKTFQRTPYGCDQ